MTLEKETKYIKRIAIKGYKRFENFEVEFQPGLNILIGENSVGKSTIIEAINIVLNQSLFNKSFGNFQQKLNNNNVKNFFHNTRNSIDKLPSISIELELNLPNLPEYQRFCGTHYQLIQKPNKNIEKFGIRFEYSFDEDYEDEFNNIDFTKVTELPVEFYHSKWETFSGLPYVRNMNPVKNLLIDNSDEYRDVYGRYARNLYKNAVDLTDQRKLSFSFNQAIKKVIEDNDKLLDMDEGQKFAIDQSKGSLFNLIELQKNGISLANMGKGEENIVKTSLSLNNKSKTDLVMIEEPENHLSYSNTRKQIARISQEQSNVSQIIATTHESMVLNRLNLSKAIWIKGDVGSSLKDLPKDDAEYFERADNFDILRYILGHKIILVEGASEFILLPSIIKKVLHKSIDEAEISVISMRGIEYSHFSKLANIVHKKTLVLTDNDGDEDKINQIAKNKQKDNFCVKTDKDTNEFTLEVAIYNHNKELCNKIINNITKGKLTNSRYKEHSNLPIVLAAMLARKTSFALELSKEINSGETFTVPKYIKEGIEWLDS